MYHGELRVIHEVCSHLITSNLIFLSSYIKARSFDIGISGLVSSLVTNCVCCGLSSILIRIKLTRQEKMSFREREREEAHQMFRWPQTRGLFQNH